MKWRALLEFLVCFNCSGPNYQNCIEIQKKSPFKNSKQIQMPFSFFIEFFKNSNKNNSQNLVPAWNTKSDVTILHSWNDWVTDLYGKGCWLRGTNRFNWPPSVCSEPVEQGGLGDIFAPSTLQMYIFKL